MTGLGCQILIVVGSGNFHAERDFAKCVVYLQFFSQRALRFCFDSPPPPSSGMWNFRYRRACSSGATTSSSSSCISCNKISGQRLQHLRSVGVALFHFPPLMYVFVCVCGGREVWLVCVCVCLLNTKFAKKKLAQGKFEICPFCFVYPAVLPLFFPFLAKFCILAKTQQQKNVELSL